MQESKQKVIKVISLVKRYGGISIKRIQCTGMFTPELPK